MFYRCELCGHRVPGFSLSVCQRPWSDKVRHICNMNTEFDLPTFQCSVTNNYKDWKVFGIRVGIYTCKNLLIEVYNMQP